MKIIKKISEDEMVASFLQSEIDSLRFGESVLRILEGEKINLKIIRDPDIGNVQENIVRKEILTKYRGYNTRTLLFTDFPDDVVWSRVELTQDEVLNIKYAHYDYWDELSSQTRLPKVAAENIRKGVVIFNEPNERFIKAAEDLKQGKKFAEMILVAKDQNSPIVAIEGHLRLTSYALVPEMIPVKLNAIVGFSEKIVKWGY